MHCRMLSSIPGLYPLDADSNIPPRPAVTTKMPPDITIFLLGRNIFILAETHWLNVAAGVCIGGGVLFPKKENQEQAASEESPL